MWRPLIPVLISLSLAAGSLAGPQAGPETSPPPRDTTAVADTTGAPAKEPAKPAPAPEKKPAPPPAPEKKPAPPPAPAKKPAPPPAPAASSEVIKRAVFTSAIVDREPVDQLDSLATGVDSVYFFTEIMGMDGEPVTHRWLRDGVVMAEVVIRVGGPRWRAYSMKTLLPEWTGAWTVEVMDGDGHKLAENGLVYYTEE